MSLRLFMDEHAWLAVTQTLRLRGVDVLTVRENGCRGKSDGELLDRAAELGRLMFTQDKDFLREAVRRQREGISFSGVVYAHQLRCTIGQVYWIWSLS